MINKFKVIFIFLNASLFFCQKKYCFNYQSNFEITNQEQIIKKSIIYDNSDDNTYRLFLGEKDAKIIDETYNEIHYFKRDTLFNDSLVLDYEYSLKVLFAPKIKVKDINVTKLNDLEFEIDYILENDDKKSKQKLEICLVESEFNLLGTSYIDLTKKETGMLLSHLIKHFPEGKYYNAQSISKKILKNIEKFEKTNVKKINLELYIPKIIYKNTFLKK